MKTFTSDFTGRAYSAQDFQRQLEHRLRKDWRIHKVFDKQKAYALVDDGALTTNLLQAFLKKIFKGHLTLHLIKQAKEASPDHLLLSSDCLDTYLAKRLDIFLKEEALEGFVSLTPLRTITKQECEQLASLWDIAGKSIPAENEFIARLHSQHPQTKSSMLKSFLYIEQLEKNSK